MKLIINEKTAEGKDKKTFFREVAQEAQRNAEEWIVFSGLTVDTANEKMSGEGAYSFTLDRDGGRVELTIKDNTGEQIGESIVYEEKEGYSFEDWGADVSLMLLFLVGNYGGESIAEHLHFFLKTDGKILLPQ